MYRATAVLVPTFLERRRGRTSPLPGSHLETSGLAKAKQSQFEARMKQVMYVIQKQIPCQNLKYSIFSIVNMKNAFILNT